MRTSLRAFLSSIAMLMAFSAAHATVAIPQTPIDAKARLSIACKPGPSTGKVYKNYAACVAGCKKDFPGKDAHCAETCRAMCS